MKISTLSFCRTFASRLAIASLIIAFAASLTVTAQTRVPNNVSIFNFGRVNENYFRGSQPKPDNMAELKRYGIKTVIDLRNDRLHESEGWAKEAGLQYFHIPLSTKKPATDEEIAHYLKLVNDPQNWPIYVHCKGGRHRTGEMTALYRMTSQNWTADQAYEEMKSYDFEDSWWYPRVLKNFVYSFYEAHKRGAAEAAAAAGSTIQ
jgi:tyrosine-protein phosphatase SIW14